MANNAAPYDSYADWYDHGPGSESFKRSIAQDTLKFHKGSGMMPYSVKEVEYLRWFKQNADFGPADSDVHAIMDEQYTKDTGKPVPAGWAQEE